MLQSSSSGGERIWHVQKHLLPYYFLHLLWENNSANFAHKKVIYGGNKHCQR